MVDERGSSANNALSRPMNGLQILLLRDLTGTNRIVGGNTAS